MTGTIKSLSAMSPSGFITADNGLNVYFDSSAALPDGAAGLAIGQSVTFDLDGGKWPSAINVRVPAPRQAAPRAREEQPAGTYLQYVGFEQAGSLRAYRFKRISRGDETREFVVNADLGLFAKHRVGIQEGPALSFHRVSEELSRLGPVAWPRLQCSLTDRDMLVYLASRPSAARRGQKRTPVGSATASHSA